jgi:hypothetical protein
MNSTNINVSDHWHYYYICSSPDTTIIIQDPTAVKALLDQLRASQVWQDTLNSKSQIGSEQQAEVRESPASALEDAQGESRAQPSGAAPPASVASLLSQLRTSERTSLAITTPPVSSTPTTHQLTRNIPRPPSQDLPPTQSEHRTPRPDVATSSAHVQDIRSMSFQQGLPHLTQLASDPGFLSAVSRVRFIHRPYSHKLLKRDLAAARTKRARATVVGRTTGYTEETRGKGQSCSYQVSV